MLTHQKENQKSISPKRNEVIEEWLIIPEVWQAQEVIYNAHTKHGSHLKVDPTFNEILKAGYRWDNMIVDIRDFYFKCQVWEVRTSKPRKNLIIKHIDSHKPKERYQADTVLNLIILEMTLNIFLLWLITLQNMAE